MNTISIVKLIVRLYLDYISGYHGTHQTAWYGARRSRKAREQHKREEGELLRHTLYSLLPQTSRPRHLLFLPFFTILPGASCTLARRPAERKAK